MSRKKSSQNGEIVSGNADESATETSTAETGTVARIKTPSVVFYAIVGNTPDGKEVIFGKEKTLNRVSKLKAALLPLLSSMGISATIWKCRPGN